MTTTYGRRSHERSGSIGNDDDSDLDLDLDLRELNPQTSSANGYHPTANGSKSRKADSGKDIPLRKLRFGGRRGYRRAYRDVAGDEEDLEALVGDDNEEMKQEPSTNSNHSPLLQPSVGGDAHRSKQPDLLARLRSLCFPHSSTSDLSLAEYHDAHEDHDPSADRTILVGQRQASRYPANGVSNAKYTPVSFLPRTLYNEFSFFFNMYFLLVALSQVIPALRIGYLSTYIAPLAFVLTITLGKEAIDDIARRRRDNEANSERYSILDLSSDLGIKQRRGRFSRLSKGQKVSDNKRKAQEGQDGEAISKNAGPINGPGSISPVSEILKPSKDLNIGDVLKLHKNQRLPADVIILKSTAAETAESTEYHVASANASDGCEDEEHGDLLSSGVDRPYASSETPVNQTTTEDPSAGGEAFIRTDQLDGETDWKLRLAAPLAQDLPIEDFSRLRITASKPDKKVNEFVGTLELLPPSSSLYDPPVAGKLNEPTGGASKSQGDGISREIRSQGLSIDNTAWANTVLASSSTVFAVVVYTGPQTRAALSTSASRSKTGLLENEINSLTKILCALTLALSFILVALEGFESHGGRKWYVAVMRFLILFSTIVPISLRVNLDMGKSVYAWFIERDHGIPDTVVRTSTIPEDLGRIEYLLSDKTGTLTQNEMELKKVHVGTVSYANEAMDEVSSYIRQAFVNPNIQDQAKLFTPSSTFGGVQNTGTRTRREIGQRVRDLVVALALCHNVTPTIEEVNGQTVTSYQASSPDEIAIVQFTEQVGLRLLHRDRKSITLQGVQNARVVIKVQILNIFPFTSDSKRMGIIVKFFTNDNKSAGNIVEDGELYFFQKGADTVMTSIVAANDWLDEETANMAREGLRTLVIGRRSLSSRQYDDFMSQYAAASLSLHNRDSTMARVVKEHLEQNLELLGVTGVEDKLQAQIKPSLELLRNAGIKIWMLTGDKVETARCVAVSSKLVTRGQYIHTIAGLRRKELALDALSPLQSQHNACLLIDGQSLALLLTHHRDAFISIAVRLPAVIACRCSPTQKADVAKLIRAYTGKRTACIGDGGNDVSMIQAADVGVGIVGKEGRQASLAADFSITQFAHLTKLLVWHGRNSYKRSAKLAQFVIHRGLIISVCQTVFSIASHFEPIALYRDWLLVGYATLYTMAPVFSLVLDRDVDEGLANLYPELYKELTTGRSLSYKTFFIWVGISIYQGCVIQGCSQLLVPGFYTSKPSSPTTDTTTTTDGNDRTGFKQMVSVSFTVLVLNELIMVAAEVTTWHPVMIFSIIGTAGVYFGSLPFLSGYFDLGYLITLGFWWRVAAISAASLVPVWGGKVIERRVKPPSYRKVRG